MMRAALIREHRGPENVRVERIPRPSAEEPGSVVNPVGGSTWRPAIGSMEPGRRMTICGATIVDDPGISIREIYQSHRRILGAPLGNRRDFRAVLDLLSRGELDPVADV